MGTGIARSLAVPSRLLTRSVGSFAGVPRLQHIRLRLHPSTHAEGRRAAAGFASDRLDRIESAARVRPMSLEKWPCVPDSFNSILPGDLPNFLQTGATHAVGRAVSIIDPTAEGRVDAIQRFDGYQQFCKCLRGGCRKPDHAVNCNTVCARFDVLVAKQLIAECPSTSPCVSHPVRYRCYLGLEEFAIPITVGGYRLMMVSGQFKPPEGLGDLRAALSCMGRWAPKTSAISGEMSQSLERFRLPTTLWSDVTLSDLDKKHLLRHAEFLEPAPQSFAQRLVACAEHVVEIAQRYYDLRQAQVEASILRDVASAAGKAAQRPVNERFRDRIHDALEVLRDGLGLQYVAFFSGDTETATILRLRAAAGALPRKPDDVAWPHFNWRKAGLRVGDEGNSQTQSAEWSSVGLAARSLIDKGFRGEPKSLFSSASAAVPVRLSSGPFSVILLGPSLNGVNLCKHEDFILAACNDLASRTLTMQLAEILRSDRADWERTAKMTGHRVRASIQSIGSQLETIRSHRDGIAGFTAEHSRTAVQELRRAFAGLAEVSYAAESNVPGAVDVRIAHRERLGLADAIAEAVETQQGLADERGVRLDVPDTLSALPPVYANRVLMRFLFMNLINNGLKYSYPRPEDGERVLKVKPPRYSPPPPQTVGVEVVNYGLGIKGEDRERIFEWGVRLGETDATFREQYGKGIGLWECRHIVQGHGGVITVDSTHWTRAPVRDDNINQCVTVFTVLLPPA